MLIVPLPNRRKQLKETVKAREPLKISLIYSAQRLPVVYFLNRKRSKKYIALCNNSVKVRKRYSHVSANVYCYTIHGACRVGITLNIMLQELCISILLSSTPPEYTWSWASVLSWFLLGLVQKNYIISWSAFTHTSQWWLHIKSGMCFSVPESHYLELRGMDKNTVIFDFIAP